MRGVAILLLALGPALAAGHEIVHQVDHGRAVAVRASYAGGQPLAFAQYEVHSPADPELPHQLGRTDRAGWLAFVPDVAGAWRVKVVDASGHGSEGQQPQQEEADREPWRTSARGLPRCPREGTRGSGAVLTHVRPSGLGSRAALDPRGHVRLQ